MGRALTAATIAWSVAVLAAVAGAVLPSDREQLSLALFAFAVALGLTVAILLVADGLRRRRSRRRTGAAARSPLARLEYLPAVTTRTRLIRWRGARSQVIRRKATPGPMAATELRGSAYPPPASSTRQPRTDAVAASPRAS